MDIIFLRQPHQFIRKADRPLKERIRQEVLIIQKDPFNAELLTGLKKVYCRHFTCKGVHYRIAYQVKDNIIVIALSTRENFYKKLRT